MNERELLHHVAAAQAAIAEESLAYVESVAALAASPAALALLHERPELAHALWLELRKLRPLALWVRGEAREALRLKRECALDGALCTHAESMPPAEGRECWVSITDQHEQRELGALPRGYGVVVHGPRAYDVLGALRRASPLRALGVALPTKDHETQAAPLDLVLIEHARGRPLEAPAELGARVLITGLTRAELASAHLLGGLGGVVCDGAEVLAWALDLAARGAPC